MAQRSLKAPLNLSEELTLRRIALGITEAAQLPEQSLARLRTMGLVDEANHLTGDGRQRYEDLPRPLLQGQSRPEKLVTFLATAQRQAKHS
jgi:hypothetical protein